ncbi:hypothetical protein ST47_g8188 [Ascochyta rabiei]|uniref:Uncharacterized protein n=1 Tax=Didymella rabiei TaxID=5454 RepID=A0A162ZMF0_DIDRA|nr:hypothetical protein ST47_g8188 [Ascochyta rabiei]
MSSLDQQNEWHLLLEDSVTVPTSILQNIINLAQVTPNNKSNKGKEAEFKRTIASVYYVREFVLSAVEARKVSEIMNLDGYYMNRNLPLTTHGSGIQALYSSSLRSFLGRSNATAVTHCQHVVTAAKNRQDTTEQVLIAPFGDGVLNTEQDGKDFITLSSDDKMVFDTLETATYNLLSSLTACSELSMRNLGKYADAVANYVAQNETTRKGYRSMHEFTRTAQDMLVRQGAFQELPDISALVISLSSDLSDNHEGDEKPFFEAVGHIADVMTALINHFGYWEDLLTPYNGDLTGRLAARPL